MDLLSANDKSLAKITNVTLIPVLSSYLKIFQKSISR